jgi:hypothetical protein
VTTDVLGVADIGNATAHANHEYAPACGGHRNGSRCRTRALSWQRRHNSGCPTPHFLDKVGLSKTKERRGIELHPARKKRLHVILVLLVRNYWWNNANTSCLLSYSTTAACSPSMPNEGREWPRVNPTCRELSHECAGVGSPAYSCDQNSTSAYLHTGTLKHSISQA